MSSIAIKSDDRCPICSSSLIQKSHHVNSYPLIKCAGCGVEFLRPQPADEVLNSIYDENYFIGSESDEGLERARALKRATAQSYMKQVKSLSKIEKGDILEIGCGSGDFLVEAQLAGYTVFGLEISAHAVSVANQKLKANSVKCGSFAELFAMKESFDVIALFDVIEHLQNPYDAIIEVYKHIKPGGVVVIVTPSIDSWSSKLLGKHWMEYKTEHLWYFSKKSIRVLLERADFTGIEWFSNKKVLSLDYINLHFQKYKVPLISGILQLFCKLAPKQVLYHPFPIVASGMALIARKPK